MSIIKQETLFYQMGKPENAFAQNVDKQMQTLTVELHREMMSLVYARDRILLQEFSEAILLKVTEVQQYVLSLMILGLPNVSPEKIAGYAMFVQQLLAIYQASNVHFSQLNQKLS